MINPDVCSCCGETWNRNNLKHIPLGKHVLHLCPDCYAEYIKPLDKTKTEIEQIVIDIPKYVYNTIVACNGYISDCDNIKVGNAIKNGTLLPKRHGDLIDRDAVNSRYDGIYAELDSLSNKPTYKVLLDKLSMCLDTEIPIVKTDVEE